MLLPANRGDGRVIAVLTELLVTIDESGADARRLDELTVALRRELLNLDVRDVAPVSDGQAPDGARSGDVAVVGALLVVIRSSVELAARVVDTVREWIRGGPENDRSVRLQLGDRVLEVSGVSSTQQDRLIQEFVQAIEER